MTIKKGYQPEKGMSDEAKGNPPQGGSGVPNIKNERQLKEETEQAEKGILDLVTEKTWKEMKDFISSEIQRNRLEWDALQNIRNKIDEKIYDARTILEKGR